MSKNHAEVKTLSEAIAHLENAGQSKSQDLKNMIEGDFEKIKKSLEEITPYFNDLKKTVEAQAQNTKNEVEAKVKENPWIALGVVGLFAFFIGWISSSKFHRHDD